MSRKRVEGRQRQERMDVKGGKEYDRQRAMRELGIQGGSERGGEEESEKEEENV